MRILSTEILRVVPVAVEHLHVLDHVDHSFADDRHVLVSDLQELTQDPFMVLFMLERPHQRYEIDERLDFFLDPFLQDGLPVQLPFEERLDEALQIYDGLDRALKVNDHSAFSPVVSEGFEKDLLW